MKIKRLTATAQIPSYATNGAAGFDLAADEHYYFLSGESATISTGLAFEIPVGYEMQIRPRSGLSSKTKLRVIFGTVDSDYRGEVKIIIENIGQEGIEIFKGDRIAQGVISIVSQVPFEEVEELSQTERNENGFGSTGK